MGPSEVYTTFELEGHPASAAYTLNKQQAAQGVPPHWAIYIAVESADATAARVPGLGGKVILPPFDVMEFGRMAVLQDPTGAVFEIWQPKLHTGIRIEGVAGTLCWADLSSPDPDAAGKFYTGLFGWTLDPGQDNSGYLHIKNGEKYIGGVQPVAYRQPGVPAHWMAYLLVDSCDAIAEKAKGLGASFHMPPTTMENIGRMAVIADPQGAVFALFQPLPHK